MGGGVDLLSQSSQTIYSVVTCRLSNMSLSGEGHGYDPDDLTQWSVRVTVTMRLPRTQQKINPTTVSSLHQWSCA